MDIACRHIILGVDDSKSNSFFSINNKIWWFGSSVNSKFRSGGMVNDQIPPFLIFFKFQVAHIQTWRQAYPNYKVTPLLIVLES